MLDRGVDINLTDTARLDDGFNLYPGGTDSSLHLLNNVAAEGNIDLFDHLVGRGADVSLCTALHSASACQDADMSITMVRHLLDKYHMDINRDNDDFRNFFHMASDKGTPLCSAILNRNLPVVIELLKRGASPEDPHGYPVSYAMKEDGFLPAVEPLLQAGADPTSALVRAVGYHNLNAAEMCLQSGADPKTALHKVLEREKARIERRGGADDSGMSKREIRAVQKTETMIEWLRRTIDGDADALS